MNWRAAATRAAARYARLALGSRGGMGGRVGERRFPGHPQAWGLEVEAYTSYAPGDDLRYLDWSALARLEVTLTRRFTAEREVEFHLLLDCSASMALPAADGKFAAARELALALGAIALAAGDAIRVGLLPGDGSPQLSRIHRRPASLLAVAEAVGAARPAGTLDLGAALVAHARRCPRPAVALVISDFMLPPAELQPGVEALRARRYDVALLHVIGPGELDPARTFDDALLEDVEAGGTRAVVLTADVQARYAALLTEHLAVLEALATTTQARYARLVSDASVPAFVTDELVHVGLVRRR